jgi:hypothetical protein
VTEHREMTILVVSGLSGAGKSTALRALEDVGFFCVDNLPLPLIGRFVELLSQAGEVDRIALVADAREGLAALATDYRAPAAWTARCTARLVDWRAAVAAASPVCRSASAWSSDPNFFSAAATSLSGCNLSTNCTKASAALVGMVSSWP